MESTFDQGLRWPFPRRNLRPCRRNLGAVVGCCVGGPGTPTKTMSSTFVVPVRRFLLDAELDNNVADIVGGLRAPKTQHRQRLARGCAGHRPSRASSQPAALNQGRSSARHHERHREAGPGPTSPSFPWHPPRARHSCRLAGLFPVIVQTAGPVRWCSSTDRHRAPSTQCRIGIRRTAPPTFSALTSAA